MDFIRTDFEAHALFPNDSNETFALLFRRRDEDAADSVFRAMTWPKGWQRKVVDVELAPRTAKWFGITQTPAIAVVRGGILLAVEHKCSPEICSRLTWWANAQQLRMATL